MTAFIKELQGNNCSKATVDRVSNWYQKLPDNQKEYAKKISNYIDTYNKFFNARNLDDIRPLINSGCFSKYQKNVMQEAYGQNWEAFNKVKEACGGMSFSRPLEIRLVDESGKRKINN